MVHRLAGFTLLQDTVDFPCSLRSSFLDRSMKRRQTGWDHYEVEERRLRHVVHWTRHGPSTGEFTSEPESFYAAYCHVCVFPLRKWTSFMLEKYQPSSFGALSSNCANTYGRRLRIISEYYRSTMPIYIYWNTTSNLTRNGWYHSC